MNQRIDHILAERERGEENQRTAARNEVELKAFLKSQVPRMFAELTAELQKLCDAYPQNLRLEKVSEMELRITHLKDRQSAEVRTNGWHIIVPSLVIDGTPWGCYEMYIDCLRCELTDSGDVVLSDFVGYYWRPVELAETVISKLLSKANLIEPPKTFFPRLPVWARRQVNLS